MDAREELVQEKEILELLKADDDRAFDLMVELFGPMLYRYALRMCGPISEAEDVLQDTFLTAREKIGQFRGDGRLRNWLFTIAGNSCRQRRRSAQGRQSRELDVDDVDLPLDQAVDYDPPRWQRSPMEVALNAELVERLEQAIARVPETNRSALLLRDVEGLSTRETAEVLGISEEAVKIRLHRARAFVRNLLADYVED